MGRQQQHQTKITNSQPAATSPALQKSAVDSISEFQEIFGSRAASRQFRSQQPDAQAFSLSAKLGMPTIQAKPSFRGLSSELTASTTRTKLQSDVQPEDNPLQGKFPSNSALVKLQDRPEPQENKTGLPDALKAGIENLSGIAMDDVKVHYNSYKPSQLEALAYTQGTDIHLAPSQEKHLPHEAWHVVQQKQGRVQPMLQMKGVSINNNLCLEREADIMGEKAANSNQYLLANNSSLINILPLSEVSLNIESLPIQRLEKGERPFEQGYTKILQHNSWMPKAEAYEKKLGSFTSHDRRANDALNSGITKMKTVMQNYYRIEFSSDQAGLLKKFFFRDDKTSAGQVGLNLDLTQMLKVLDTGNLRERMTAFYNASYYGSGYENNIQKGFKAILQDIVLSQKWDVSNNLGLDTDSLKSQSGYMTGWTRSGIHKIVSTIAEEKAYNYSPDVFALGNLTYQTDDYSLTNTREIAESQKDRKTRSSFEKQQKQKTPQDYENMDVPLSDEELGYSFPAEPDKAKTKTQKLPWEEGTALFEIAPTNSWYQRIHEHLRMPVVAGISGTTTRLLNSFKWLNTGQDALNFRLAIMGWMLTSWDHSLYEILRGSHIAGVKGNDEEKTTKDAIRMYMNIPPLTIAELRNNVAEDKMFPHEFLYHEMALEDNLINPHLKVPGKDKYGNQVALEGIQNLYDQTSGRKKYGYEKISEAHAIAINSYTSGTHTILNSVMSFMNFPESVAKSHIRSKLKSVVHNYGRKELLEAKETAGTITPEETQELNNIKVEWIDVLTPKRTNIKANLGNLTLTDTERQTYETDVIEPWIDNLVEELYPELQMHANMTVEGLQNIDSLTGVTVWRGDWLSKFSPNYNKGKIVSFNTFTSFSKDRDQAKEFTQSGTYSDRMLIELTLNGIGGKDISALSMYDDEEEVLLMPGSKIEITDAQWGIIDGKDVWEVSAREV